MAVLLPLVAFSVLSCQKELLIIRSGKSVDFSIGISGPTVTKTAYSGEAVGGRERIDWCSGDILRIHCAEAATDDGKNFADYKADHDGVADGAISETRISVVDGRTGLKWSDAESFTFNAVYPSPEASANEDDSFGEGSSPATLTGSIPSSQTSSSVSHSGSLWTVTPDMTSQYMIARTVVANDGHANENINGDGHVFLEFYPLTTAIRFTIENGTASSGTDGDMYIDAVSLISESSRIFGGFTTDLSGWDGGSTLPDCIATESGSVSGQEVKLDLSSKSVVLKDGETLTFTIFLLPAQDVDDLTFKVYRHDKDGNSTWMSTKLAYNDASRKGVLFKCHTLTEVKGLLLPDSARWQVKYAPEIGPWTSQDEGGTDFEPEDDPLPFVTSWDFGAEIPAVMVKYYYTFTSTIDEVFSHDGGNGSLIVTSTKEKTHDEDEAVLWHLEYYDEEASEWIVPDEEPYYINDFVSFSQVSGTSLNPQTVTMDVKAADPAKGEVTTGISHTARLRDVSESKGSEAAPYDLSMHDIHGNARPSGKPVTANSYVISHPGVYAFPLVYGNGVDYNMAPAGGDNANAYDPGSEMVPTDVYLTRFPNAYGIGIRSPFIELDLKADDISGWQAYPVWQDAASSALISGGTCTVLTNAQASAKGLTACNSGYVMFTVPDESLVQGNAVIAVTDGTRIIWSWHIWFTDNDLTPVEVKTDDEFQTAGMLPVDLGWVDDSDAGETYYSGNSLRIRLVQDGSKAEREYTIVRKDESTCIHTAGSSPYYQWGRKDPFIRAFNHGGTWEEYSDGDVTLHEGVPAVSKVAYSEDTHDLPYSIQQPTHFIFSDSGMWYHALSGISTAANFYNLWSALNGASGHGILKDKPIKTIYDPCPPGFQVPQGNGFSRFSTAVTSGSFQNGYYFKTGYATAGTDNTVFFHATGSRSGGSGDITANGSSGSFWTAAPYGRPNSYRMAISGGSVLPTTNEKWTEGYTVRPVAE